MNKEQNNISFKTFIGLLRQAVMFYPKQPKDMECLRPSTFIMLEKHNQLNASNLGITQRHAEKDYYFSRTAQPKYPIVTGWVQSKSYQNLFAPKTKGNKSKECYRFEMLVLDQYNTDCKNCTPCQKRTIHDIYCDTSDMLNNILTFFQGVIYAEIITGDESKCIWANSQILDQMVECGEIESYTQPNNSKKTTWFQTNFFTNSQSITAKLYDHFTMNNFCLLYTSPSPRDQRGSRMPSSA